MQSVINVIKNILDCLTCIIMHSNMSLYNLSIALLYLVMQSIIYMFIMNIVMLCTVI